MWLACRARCHGVYKRHLDESLFARQFRYDAARDASLSAICELRAQAAQLHSQSSLARGSGQHGPSRTRDVSERGASGASAARSREIGREK